LFEKIDNIFSYTVLYINMNKTIPGYKGIMELDLSGVHPSHHRELIKQHKQDIENYRQYQESLEPELRYENTIHKILTDKAFYDKIRDAKIEQKKTEENNRFRELLEKYI